MKRGHPGFTLIELMVVVLIVGILARIAIPSYRQMVLKARAAEALSNIQAIRVAAYAYNSEHNRWPPDAGPGVSPPELRPYLGDGFAFDRDEYQLDWDNWVLPDGSPKHPETGVLLGVSLTTADPAFGQALVELLGPSTAHYTLGQNYTFVIAAL